MKHLGEKETVIQAKTIVFKMVIVIKLLNICLVAETVRLIQNKLNIIN